MGNISPFKIVLIFVVAAVLSCLILWYAYRKRKKSELAEHYNISKPTLLKWVRFYPCGIPLDSWKKKRMLNQLEFTSITNKWGEDSSMVLSKEQIAEKAESNYKTVAENVKKNIEKIGISLEAWESSNVFPPTISARILEVLG